MEPVFSFGEWVRRRRRALELTQAELGERVGLAAVSIHKIEADERRPSPESALRLARALHIPPTEHDLFLRAARAMLPVDRLEAPVTDELLAAPNGVREAPRSPAAPLALTPLLGRDTELAELQQLLAQPEIRLITVTGPGGVGKTRLALALAESLGGAVLTRVIFAPLDEVTDPAAVPLVILHCGSLRETGPTPLDDVVAYARAHRCVLILDNFEHLLEAALDVATLLSAAPTCRIVVTSRAPLHLQGEHEYQLEPLALPPDARGTGDWGWAMGSAEDRQSLSPAPDTRPQDYPAIQLFIERARAVQHDLPLHDAALATIVAICRRLDGLPLAIELAAARVRMLPPPALLAQLKRHDRSALDFLTGGARDLPPRQQTLRHTLEWSYQLLTDAEKILFRRLAIFAGGWTLDAAVAIAGDDGEELEDNQAYSHPPVPVMLYALLDHHLVYIRAEQLDDPRFAMLETIRAFALELLGASGEADLLRRRHARYYAEFAGVSDQAHRGRSVSAHWSDMLANELANLRTVLQWSIAPDGDLALGMRLAGRLGYWWLMAGYQREALGWLEQLLHVTARDGAPDADVALALYWAGNHALYLFDSRRAREWFSQARLTYQALGDADGVAYLDFALGRLARDMGEYQQAEQYVTRALDYYRLVDDWRRRAFALESLADIALDHGITATANRWLWEAYDLFSVHDDMVGVAEALCNLARCASLAGDHQMALHYCEQSLNVARQHRIIAKIQYGLIVSGRESLLAGNDSDAFHYLEQAVAFARSQDNQFWLATALVELGCLSRRMGNMPHAVSCLGDALRLFTDLQLVQYDGARCFEELAGIALEWRQPRQAIRLFGVAAALRERICLPRLPVEHRELERDVALARAQLDPHEFDAAWAEGAALPLSQAIAEALCFAGLISSPLHMAQLP